MRGEPGLRIVKQRARMPFAVGHPSRVFSQALKAAAWQNQRDGVAFHSLGWLDHQGPRPRQGFHGVDPLSTLGQTDKPVLSTTNSTACTVVCVTPSSHALM